MNGPECGVCPPEGGEAPAERERLLEQPPCQRRKRFRLENEALCAKQRLNERDLSRVADEAKRTAEGGGVGHTILFRKNAIKSFWRFYSVPGVALPETGKSLVW